MRVPVQARQTVLEVQASSSAPQAMKTRDTLASAQLKLWRNRLTLFILGPPQLNDLLTVPRRVAGSLTDDLKTPR